jgi:hypothetical protein
MNVVVQDLLQEAYSQVITEMAPNTVITLYLLARQINTKNGFDTFNYADVGKAPLDTVALAKQWKIRGITTKDVPGLSVDFNGKDIPKILCQHLYFTNDDGENTKNEMYVIFKKSLSEIFIEPGEYELEGFGIPEDKEDAVRAIVDAKLEKGIPVSVSEIAKYMNLNRGEYNQMYGSYVDIIKPHEIIDIRICPGGNPDKSKSLLTQS